MADLVYTPGIKTKRGEMRAVQELSRASEGMLPLIDLLAVPEDASLVEVQSHIDKCLKYLTAAWPSGRPFYMDLFDVHPSVRGPRNTHPATIVLRTLREKGFQPIPVIGLDRDAAYLRAVRDVLGEDGEAICVRLQQEDFLNARQTAAAVQTLLQQLGAADLDQHVILDFRSIQNSTLSAVLTSAANIYRALAEHGYTRYVFLASSMSNSLSYIPANTVARISRQEISIWNQLRQVTGGDIVYGDYGVVHPDYVDLDPRLIKPAAKIRYAYARGWVVVKGTVWRNDTGQFQRLAAAITRQPEHRSTASGWGEQYLRDCVVGQAPSSTLERWVAVDTNTHLQLAVRQVTRILAGVPIEAAV